MAAWLVLCGAVTSGVTPVQASEPNPRRHAGGSGCAALEARIARAADPEARLELADCYAQAGRTASAWAQYREVAAAARSAGARGIEALARAQAKALEAELSYLTIDTWRGQAVLVTRDAAPIDEAVLGTAVPIDPGRYVIGATARGKRSWSTTVQVGPHGDHVSVSVPVLPDDVGLVAAELPPAAPKPRTEAAPEYSSAQRTVGLIVGAVGIAAIATGAVFGVKAASDWSDAKTHCKPYPYCGADGDRLARSAKNSAVVSTVSFAAGLAGLTAGAVLWFTSDRSEQKPAVGVGVGQVVVAGAL